MAPVSKRMCHWGGTGYMSREQKARKAELRTGDWGSMNREAVAGLQRSKRERGRERGRVLCKRG